MKKWSIQEKKELSRVVSSGWDGTFPGYGWVSEKLNGLFNNNRTSASVIAMCRKLGV